MAALANDEHALVNGVLGDLERNGSIADSWPYAIQKNIAHNEIVGAIKKLDNDEFTTSTVIEAMFYEVTDEGKGNGWEGQVGIVRERRSKESPRRA